MYNTGNPVPSTALEDMADNAQTFDALVTKIEGTTTDRFGRTRRVFQQILMDMGFQPLSGSFQTGATITARNQALYDEVSHVFYAWGGVLPKVVSSGSTPATAGGVGVGLWSDKTDLTLRSQLLSDTGTTLIKDRGEIVGQQTRTQHEINSDEISIYDFGGIDDCDGYTTGTNNFTAVSSYFTYLNTHGGVARFQKKGTGGYYINGSEAFAELSSVEIVADEGVYFVFDGSWTPIITKGIKCNRQIRIHIVSLNYDFYIGPEQYRKPSEVMPTLTQMSGTYEQPVTILGSDFTGYLLDTVNGRDTTSLTTTSINVSIPFSSTSEKKVASTSCRIGDEVGATIYAETGKICFGVVTVAGYALVEQQLSDSYTVLNRNGSLSTVRMSDYSGARNQFNLASLSVQIISDKKFSALVNGINVGTFDSDSPIIGIAFGATGTTKTTVVTNIYKLTGAKTPGSRPLRILCLGDSTSDPAVPCSQFDYMRQFLAAAGCQAIEINNIAVSGETSAQQKARFDVLSIAPYDYCVTQVGINDIQGGVPVSSFIANMEGIADRCNANGVKLIAGVPTLWYSSAEAELNGQTGQNTLNNELGAPYRNQLIRTMAAKNSLVTTMQIKNEGVISAEFLSIAGIDPVLMDNIHPTAYGRMMMGLGSAMAIIGAQNPVGVRSVSNVVMPARWKSSFTSASAVIPLLLVKNGELTFQGSIDIPSAPSNGTVILAVDKELSNGTYSYLTVPCQSASGPIGTCNVVIDGTGNVSVYGVPAGTTNIVLDGVTIRKLS